MAERTPRRVHLVWLGSAVPARVDQVTAEIRQHDPTVEVSVWTDEDLGWLENHDELVAEPRMSGKANIARYELLHRYGGIYLDADFRVHRSLEAVFTATDTHGLVVARQSRVVYNPAFIAAVPGHPVLTRAVSGIRTSRRRFADMTSPARTGPHYFTSVLMDHLRDGGAFGELPQHAVFPWYSDEDPLPDRLLPPSVVMSHEWATAGGGWSWGTADDGPADVRVPDRHTRMRRNGGSVRARASTTPVVHRAVARLECLRDRIPARTATVPEDPNLDATTAVLEGWCAREIRRRLRGSAIFLDLHPATLLPALAATQVLDRPGRTIVVHRVSEQWRSDLLEDRSIRCSVHGVAIDPSDGDAIAIVRSIGSALAIRQVDPDRPPLGHTDSHAGIDLPGLITDIPRFDLVRVRSDRLTSATAAALEKMARIRRIAQLVMTVDPLAASEGLEHTIELLTRLDSAGLRIRLGPWLVDGRGRSWREQFRGAARPFIVAVGP